MQRYGIIAALLACLILGVVLRGADIGADLPQYFLSKSQDLTTDGPYLTLYARSAVEQGSWDPLGYEPWRQFKLSLISGAGYLLYQSFGVTRAVSNLAGAILSLAGILLFLSGLSRFAGRRSLLVASVLLTVSYPLVMFARVPLAENSVIFFAGAIFFVFSRWFESIWGLILTGLLIALAGLLGKSTGFFLLAAPIAYLAICDRPRFLMRAGLLVAVVAITTLIYSLILLPGGNLFSFLYEHSAGVHGTPYGLTSPIGYLETLISFGRSRLHRIAPVESLLAYIYLVLILLLPQLRNRSNDKAVTFLAGWLVAWVVGMAPFNYLPMRYALPIVLPLAALGALWLDSPTEKVRPTLRWPAWWKFGLLMLLNWYGCFVMANALISDSMVLEVVRAQIWYSLPAAAAVTLILVLILRTRTRVISDRIKQVGTIAVVVAALVVEVLILTQWWGTRTHTIDEAIRDLPAVVGEQAAIGGPYGPAIADGNGLQGFPLFISADFEETKSVLSQYAVTHLAVSYEEWQRLIAEVPALANATVVTRYWLRDNMVIVVRIAGLFGGASRHYQLSQFELAQQALLKGDKSAGLLWLRRAVQQFPHAKSPLIELYHQTASPENAASLQPLVDTLVAYNRTDFTVNLLGAVYYKYLAQVTSNDEYLETAQLLRQRAIDLSPTNQSVVENGFRHYDPTDRILR